MAGFCGGESLLHPDHGHSGGLAGLRQTAISSDIWAYLRKRWRTGLRKPPLQAEQHYLGNRMA
jgi:hypothetical protein